MLSEQVEKWEERQKEAEEMVQKALGMVEETNEGEDKRTSSTKTLANLRAQRRMARDRKSIESMLAVVAMLFIVKAT